MQLNVQQLPPPVNDNFADAMTIGAVPFAHSVDLAAATTEPGERINPTGAFTTIEASAWYVFTTTGTEPLSVNANPAGLRAPGFAGRVRRYGLS